MKARIRARAHEGAISRVLRAYCHLAAYLRAAVLQCYDIISTTIPNLHAGLLAERRLVCFVTPTLRIAEIGGQKGAEGWNREGLGRTTLTIHGGSARCAISPSIFSCT